MTGDNFPQSFASLSPSRSIVLLGDNGTTNGLISIGAIANLVVPTDLVGLATVAKTGSYNDLSNTPVITNYALLASPTFTGVPILATPPVNNTTPAAIATTGYVNTFVGTGGPYSPGSVAITGGSINAVTIGSSTPSTGSFTSLSSGSGSLNGSIGSTTPSTGSFTTLAASGNLSGFVTSTGSSTSRSLAARGADFVNVLDFGADKTGATDCSTAVQAAITFALTNTHSIVYFPTGIYWFPATGSRLSINVPSNQSLTVLGDGMESSILNWQEGTSSTYGSSGYHALFYNANSASPTYGNLTFESLQFRGTLGVGTTNVGGPALALNGFTSIKLLLCKFINATWMATQCEFIQNVLVEGCIFDSCMRDNCRFRSSFNVIINGNLFKHSDDDAVALHSNSIITTAGQMREGLIVTNNVFEDTCGVHILGARMVRIAGNIFRRSKVQAIGIATDSGEGANPIFGITVVDNDIYDTISRAPTFNNTAAPIYIGISPPASGTLPTTTDSDLPGEFDTTALAFILPYAYRNANNTVTGDAFPNAYGIRVDRNRIMRTLTPVANYSAWGFGQVATITTTTGFADSAVTEAGLRHYQSIGISSTGIGISICDNQIMNSTLGIGINGNTVSNVSLSFIIARNQFYDVAQAAIAFNTTIENAADGMIADNMFDLDPYHLSAQRKSPIDGTFISTATLWPSVLIGTNLDGVQFHRNVIKNVIAVIPTITNLDANDNVLVCQPVAAGSNIGNAGIQQLPAIGKSYRLQIRNCNPTSGTYGALLNNCLISSTSIPSTGYYVIGHFVEASGVINVFGWKRITTGSAHVLGVDWLPIMLGGGLLNSASNQFSSASTVSAAGTTVGTSTKLTSAINTVTTVAAGTGVRMPDVPGGTASSVVWVVNNGANPLNVYPQTSGNFSFPTGLSGALPVILPVGAAGMYAVSGSGSWLAFNAGGLTSSGSIVLEIVTVTTGSTYVVLATDYTIAINKTTGSATGITLPTSPSTGRELVIKDAKGDANTNNITITPAAGLIDGSSTLVINTAYGKNKIIYSGTAWNVI